MSNGLFEKWMWSYLGIIIEAVPFLLIGAVISAFIQMYITEELINKIIRKNKFLSYIIASLSGIFLPICECAIVPISKSLIKKGLPISLGITFMLAVPIVNPVVIMSTYYAFPNDINIVIIRILGGIIGAIVTGIIIGKLYNKQSKITILKDDINTGYCSCCNLNTNYYVSGRDKIKALILNASNEFLNISVYFIIGAFISSIFIVLIGDKYLSGLKLTSVNGILIMMLLGFALSLCSEADAFIAKGFLSNVGVEGVIAFLILGPMMDLKNFILTLGLFKRKFVLTLTSIIFIVVLIFSLLISFISI